MYMIRHNDVFFYLGYVLNIFFQNLAISLYVANKVGGKRAPCSSFPCIVKAGDKSIEEIISGIDRGIIVGRFSGGDPGSSGDFSGVAKNSFLIENGRLTMPVKDINIIGNGPQALADIKAVGNDLKIDNGTWTCGKEQSVPVSCGMPSILIGSLTVGGE